MTDKHKSKKELENEGKETVEIFQDLDQTALKQRCSLKNTLNKSELFSVL